MPFLQLRTIPANWRNISISTVLSWAMKLLMVGLVPFELYGGYYLFSLAILVAVGLSMVPSLVQRNYNITLPFELDLLVTLSIFLHTFFGESLDFYQKYWVWDKILHLYGGAVTALLAFVIVYTLHYTKKVDLSIPFIGFFTVIFAMAVGAFWEIGEFSVDVLFAKSTQKGLVDTMWDLINDLIGGVLAAGLGMLYVRYSNPDRRKKLAKPLGQVFGLADRIDQLKESFGDEEKKARKKQKKAGKGKRRKRT